MEDELYMREALKEAARAREENNWAIGCVITLNGKIIARGRNHIYTQQNRLLHAEVDAIAEMQSHHFDFKGKDFTLYTTLEPCPMCFGAIMLSGIRRVVAGTNLDSSGASAMIEHLPEFFQLPHFKTTITTGVLEKECEEMWLSGAPVQGAISRGATITRTAKSGKRRVYSSPTIIKNADGKVISKKKRLRPQATALKALFSSLNN